MQRAVTIHTRQANGGRALRGVLFDKDGTLLDFARTWLPINRDAALFAARGDEAVAGELLRLGGQDSRTGAVVPGSPLAAGTHEEVAEVFAAHLGATAPAGLADAIGEIFATGGACHAVAVEGVLAVLEALAGLGIAMGVATNDTAAGLAASLARAGVPMERFVFLAGCDSGYGAKPGPGMAHAFAAATGLDAACLAVVGDAVHDLEMGRRAGVGLKVGVLGGTSSRADLAPHADEVIGAILELPALVSAWRGRAR